MAMQRSQEESCNKYSEAGQQALAAGHYEEAEKRLQEAAPNRPGYCRNARHARRGLFPGKEVRPGCARTQAGVEVEANPHQSEHAAGDVSFRSWGIQGSAARLAEVLPASIGSGHKRMCAYS